MYSHLFFYVYVYEVVCKHTSSDVAGVVVTCFSGFILFDPTFERASLCLIVRFANSSTDSSEARTSPCP